MNRELVEFNLFTLCNLQREKVSYFEDVFIQEPVLSNKKSSLQSVNGLTNQMLTLTCDFI